MDVQKWTRKFAGLVLASAAGNYALLAVVAGVSFVTTAVAAVAVTMPWYALAPFLIGVFLIAGGIALLLLRALVPRGWLIDHGPAVDVSQIAPPGAHPRSGWVTPQELGAYLESIRRTMDEHGFGDRPPQDSGLVAEARSGRRDSDLQKIRLIRNEIDDGLRIVGRAVGVNQVYEVVDDTNWTAHRNELAAIPEAGNAHRLAGAAWDGFRRYNNAVKGRTHIADDALTEIADHARRAVDALGIAADDVRVPEI